MNPATLSTTAHDTHTHTQPPTHVKIIKLELRQQDSRRYDILLHLCRPLTSYEKDALAVHRTIGLEISPDDPSQLIATHTTVEEVHDRLPEFHELLSAAAANGHAAQYNAMRAREAIATEEIRRQSLVSDVNSFLGGCPQAHDRVVEPQ